MSLSGKTILVVDDDEDILALVKKIIEVAGANCITVGGAKAGIKSATTESPDLIICDLSMPDVDGFSFLEEKRSIEKLREVPVLVFSAEKDPERLHRAMALGATDYLKKPLQAALLLQKIRKILLSSGCISFVELSSKPSVEVQFRGDITSISRDLFILDSIVKLVPSKAVKIRAQLLEECGVDCISAKVLTRAATTDSTGRYRTKLKIMGTPTDLIPNIERIIRGKR